MPATDVRRSAGTAGAERTELVVACGIFGLGGLLSWLCRVHPARLPDWAPWDFSWPEFLAICFSIWWFLRGLGLIPAAARPPLWRTISFLLGVAAIYAVRQMRFEYWSQHMFFRTRIQHVAMHHIGPYLIAIGALGVIWAFMSNEERAEQDAAARAAAKF
jgi:putative membrane protein